MTNHSSPATHKLSLQSVTICIAACCIAALPSSAMSAYVFDGTTTVRLSVPTDDGWPGVTGYGGGVFTGTSRPATLFYAFNFPNVQGMAYNGYVSVNSGGYTRGVENCPARNCGNQTFGRIERFGGIANVQLWGSIGTWETASASITIGYGGDTDGGPGPPNKYDDDAATIYVPEGAGEATIEEGPNIATDTTGGYLTSTSSTAVVEEHGYSDYLAVISPPALSPTVPPGWSPGYFFSSSDIPFTHFLIPEALPGGDSEFTLIFGEYESHTLQAGVPFDFTAYASGGVTAFILKGFDADEGLLSDTAFPYEHRFRFAEQGATTIRHGLLLPGDYSLGGVVNEKDYSIWRAGFGAMGAHRADGNQDGVVNAADYVLWRKWQASAAPASGAGALASVPEPRAYYPVLLCCAVACASFRLPR